MTECKPNWRADSFHLTRAARCLRRGGVVAHATEGVWGLACDPFNANAVGRLLTLKARDRNKGLIVIAADPSYFAAELAALDADCQAAVLTSWPGPVSWAVPNQRFAAWITGQHTSVAIRVPGHAQAQALCSMFDGPLVSTSANLAGRASTKNVLKVRKWFGDRLDYVLPGSTGDRARPSEIRTVTGRVLR